MDSKAEWTSLTSDYLSKIDSSYHRNRLRIAMRMLQQSVVPLAGSTGLDFGCGDGIAMAMLRQLGVAEMHGCDIESKMIDAARTRLGAVPGKLTVEGVSCFDSIASGSLDFVLSLNVLAYLTTAEIEIFYRGAARVLKPNGAMVVSHSNELFDLYALNRFTVEFLERHFVSSSGVSHGETASLLARPEEPQGHPSYNVRANPLAYPEELAKWGLEEERQEFFNYHRVPPLLIPDGVEPGGFVIRADELHRLYELDELDKLPTWKKMIACSTYFSQSRKGT